MGEIERGEVQLGARFGAGMAGSAVDLGGLPERLWSNGA
jgi:hypothetical protein